MARKTWTLDLEDGTHTVVLEHGTLSGKRTIWIDGQPLPEGKLKARLLDTGGDYPFAVGGHSAFVAIRTNGLTFSYDLVLDGRSLKTGRPMEPRRPGPAWGWAFVVACGLIPVVALGGALPMGIGVGGALACSAIARDDRKSAGLRVALCSGVTVLCWVLFVGIVVGVAILRAGT